MDTKNKNSVNNKENKVELENEIVESNEEYPIGNRLIEQNRNLQSQIQIMAKKINYYENDHLSKTVKLSNDIEILRLNENKLKEQLIEKDIMIDNYKKENIFLKENLNQMENTVSEFKDEVKYLANNFNLSTNNQFNENKRKTKELTYVINEYSKEIAKLKTENNKLNSKLGNLINNSNKIKEEELLNQKDINQPLEKEITDLPSYINNELSIITKWVETYLGNSYDKNFEVPSLFNENINDDSSYFNFDALKKVLEVCRKNINSILNTKETNVETMKNKMQEIQKENSSLKRELNIFKSKEYKNAENEFIIRQKNEEHEKIKKHVEKLENEYNVYLNKIYQLFQSEISSILEDENFKAFHNTLETIPPSINSNNIINIQNIQVVLFSYVESFFLFFNEFKFDYLQAKNDNIKLIKDSVGKITENADRSNIMNNDIGEFKREINEKEDKINSLESENSILKNQIRLFEKANQVKELNEIEFQGNYQKLAQKLNETENLYRKVKREMEIYKEKYEMIEKYAKRNDILINDYKKRIGYAIQLEKENKKMKSDYQRMINENNILRTFKQTTNV